MAYHDNPAINAAIFTNKKGGAVAVGKGVIFALAKQFALPIRYIGVGEGIDDLRTFEAEPFVRALFADWRALHKKKD